MNRHSAFALLLLGFAPHASTLAQEVALDPVQPKITSAGGLRVRTEPKSASKEVARLPLGTVLSAVARSGDEVEIAGRKAYWYRVTLADGKAGWAFGGLLVDYDAARRVPILRRIADERWEALGKTEGKQGFGDAVELYRFLSHAEAGTADATVKGDFALRKLQTLAASTDGISQDDAEQPPYRDWFREHAAVLLWWSAETEAGWAVKPEAYWSLEERHRGSPLGDQIAWMAAQRYRSGYCPEGDEPCNLDVDHANLGQYLKRYPDGQQKKTALERLGKSLEAPGLKAVLATTTDEATELRRTLGELRGIVLKSSGADRDAVLRLIDGLLATKK